LEIIPIVVTGGDSFGNWVYRGKITMRVNKGNRHTYLVDLELM